MSAGPNAGTWMLRLSAVFTQRLQSLLGGESTPDATPGAEEEQMGLSQGRGTRLSLEGHDGQQDTPSLVFK